MNRRELIQKGLNAILTLGPFDTLYPSIIHEQDQELNNHSFITVGDSISTITLARKVLTLNGVFSYRRDFFGVPNLPQGPSVKKRLEALHAIYEFAPELRIHPDDKYHPASVQWYLPRVRMRRDRSFRRDIQYLNTGEVNLTSLISISDDGQHSGSGSKSDFFLEAQVKKKKTRKGSLANAECYVYFRKSVFDPQSWDIQYWFFYAYSGDASGWNVAHEGDWEHITVWITRDMKSIYKVFYAIHDSEGKWRERQHLKLTEETHPVVYSAWRTHASYWSTGEQFRGIPQGSLPSPNDYTADGGPKLKTWNSLRLIGTKSHPLRNQEWIKYTGHWGEIGNTPWSSGPYGPAFQEKWENDGMG